MVACIDMPDPRLDRNPVRFLRRHLRGSFGVFPLSPEEDALLYELEEYCDSLVDPVTGLSCRQGERHGHRG